MHLSIFLQIIKVWYWRQISFCLAHRFLWWDERSISNVPHTGRAASVCLNRVIGIDANRVMDAWRFEYFFSLDNLTWLATGAFHGSSWIVGYNARQWLTFREITTFTTGWGAQITRNILTESVMHEMSPPTKVPSDQHWIQQESDEQFQWTDFSNKSLVA